MSHNDQSISVGDRVCLIDGHEGIIRYVGKIHIHKGTYYGIELVDGSNGKHDGSLDGKKYFEHTGVAGCCLAPRGCHRCQR